MLLYQMRIVLNRVTNFDNGYLTFCFYAVCVVQQVMVAQIPIVEIWQLFKV
jgi:hypothetical protein